MASLEEPDVSDYQALVTCLDCEGHKNVNSYCVDCKGNICDKCKTRRLHNEHRIFPRTHQNAVKARRKVKQRCKKHPDKEYVMFCQKCNKPCCHDCITKEHVHHAFINIEDAAKDAMTNIQAYMVTLETVVLPSIKKAFGEIMDGIEQYNQSLETAIEVSKRKFQSLHEELDQAERDWMEEMNAIKEADFAEIDRSRMDIEKKRKWTSDIISASKAALTEMSELDLLSFSQKCKNIIDLEPSTSRTLPVAVHFQPSDYKIPQESELVGCIKREEGKLIGTEIHSTASVRLNKSKFTPSMVKITPVKTLDDVGGYSITHTNNGVWINIGVTKKLTLYSGHIKNKQILKTLSLDFAICDMSTTSSNDIVVTDWDNKCLVCISKAGNVTTLFYTGKLRPWGLCINDRQQILVGVQARYEETPIKLTLYSSDGSVVLQEIEKDEIGKPLFNKIIYQVKQNGNGDYVVADYDRIVCVRGDGEYKWEYQLKESGIMTPRVLGLVCGIYNNIIIADYINDKISLLDSEGTLITTLMTNEDGIRYPFTLSIDKQERLWIGQMENVKVVKYIK